MKSHFKPLIQWLAATALAAHSVLPAAAADQYRVRDLGALSTESVFPAGINMNDDVAGRTEKRHGGGSQAFFLGHGSAARAKINALVRGGLSDAYGLNDLGQVVGSSETAQGTRAFVWAAERGTRDLGALSANANSEAFGINNAGAIVGYSTIGDQLHATLVNINGSIQDLGALPGDQSSQGFGINDAGQVVGMSSSPSGSRAFIWKAEAGMQLLPPPPGYADSLAFRINNQGTAIGHAMTSSGMRAIVWSSGQAVDIGTLQGGTFSDASAINNLGAVVGISGGVLGNRAFIWTSEKGMQDLNSLLVEKPGIVLTGAMGINDSGAIVAFGSRMDHIDPEEMTDDDHGAPLHLFILFPVGH
jgi:probable HAF family extracellular repeat protein